MVNMTPDFYNFFRNALEILGLKSWGLLTLCVFTVDVASVGRFPILHLKWPYFEKPGNSAGNPALDSS